MHTLRRAANRYCICIFLQNLEISQFYIYSVNWKGWTVAITTSCAITIQSSVALCDNNNINDNHLTRFLDKKIGPDEFIIPQQEPDAHLKQFTKPENSFIEWGMHCQGRSPKSNKFFQNIKLKTVKFSSNVQIALDVNGNLYCKYNNVWFVYFDSLYVLVSGYIVYI